MWELLTPARVGTAIATLTITLVSRFLQLLHHQRLLVKGLPGPPHSYIWGSLISFNEIVKTQPKRAAAQTLLRPLKEMYGLGDYFYLDLWPAAHPMLVLFDVDLMNEVTVKTSLPKHPVVAKYVDHVGGPGNLVTAEGAEWRKWRSAFNPGFSASHLMTLVPDIVDQCNIFCKIMDRHAKNKDLFRMEQASTKLTVDIIGKVVLDVAFDSQSRPNELVNTLLNQIKWIPIGRPTFSPVELVRPFILAFNTWKMNRYISKMLDERFASRSGRGKTKHVIDLALEVYLKEIKGMSGKVEDVSHLDTEFKTAAINNLKTIIFAGHDTTSATICYAYYYLSKNPSMLEKAREELNDVFGPDSRLVAEQIKSEPYKLNRLDYIMAVTREVLRMQPPASTLRVGSKGFFLRDPITGEALPTEGFLIWPVDVGIGLSKEYWGPDADTFRPERYLDPAGYNKEAWIAFSKGNRNCIGQELAIIETKVILAMTLRTFDFKAAFDELDQLKGDGSGYPSDSSGIQQQYGEEAYQIQLGTAKPREGMPCRIFSR